MPRIAKKAIRRARLKILKRIDGEFVIVLYGNMLLESVRKMKERAQRLYASHKAAFMELLLDIDPGVCVLEYYDGRKWTRDPSAIRVFPKP